MYHKNYLIIIPHVHSDEIQVGVAPKGETLYRHKQMCIKHIHISRLKHR